jgi:para-aminobenzoate synthetase/4-amino-4-deoxychorismate lyase
VFETLLVLDGRPVDLAPHLRRLSSSVQALYGVSPRADLAEELHAAAQGLRRARLRVDFHPGGHTGIKVSPVAPRPPLRLCPETVPGGVGAHKWCDRRLLDSLLAATDGEPLLCDLDGLVLETARANIFIVAGHSRIATPPADGRILPGVTRARVIELARGLGLEVREERVDLARLAGAAELFVTGALGGVEPAGLGSAPPKAGPVTARLADAWLRHISR